MSRAYYHATLSEFLKAAESEIIGKITPNHSQQLENLQTGAWQAQITILQDQLSRLGESIYASEIFFEFLIPRMGRRADVVLVYQGLVFVIEFKVGAITYHNADIQQAHGYALDLKNFHQGSHDKTIIPVLVATKAENRTLQFNFADDYVAEPLLINEHGITELIIEACTRYPHAPFNSHEWSQSGYKPTPTIIEAAQALYSEHAVEDISRSDAGAKNIAYTSEILFKIIHESRLKKQKSICFVTGVPGAGKTLVGLNIATQHSKPEDDEYSVFLSGNGPLVDVLKEALARDEVSRSTKISKDNARRKASQFIQNIHRFRDEALGDNEPPVEKVVIFDEAQRAWNKEQTSKFMQRKRNQPNFDQSEPEFLIEVMDRHQDWAVVIALIGGGQEINTGEAGIQEWLNAVSSKFPHWNVYYSTELDSGEYVVGDLDFEQVRAPTKPLPSLHLATSMRSFRSEKLSRMIHFLISGKCDLAQQLYSEFSNAFPIAITRDLEKARSWIRSKARANESKGLIASSNGIRLKPDGIFVKNEIQPENWFLNDSTDIRSCHFLEDTATEFDIQGLELDWCLVAWDADYRYLEGNFEHWKFKGTNWQRRRKEEDQRYLENAYRVLLTRARQGMVIYAPLGDKLDSTRQAEFYDGTYNYLKACGVKVLD